MVATVKPGDEFLVECVDWTGGQIKDDDSATDIQVVDLTKVHYLSGPIAVEGAEPGDLLQVDILDVGVLPDFQWGFTGLFAKENGGGFLTEHYPEARKACWNFSDIYANSRHIPGVEFAGIIHSRPGRSGRNGGIMPIYEFECAGHGRFTVINQRCTSQALPPPEPSR